MSTDSVAIIDSGGANIASLLYALARLDAKATLTQDAATIRRAGRVILPGVGAAADAMQRLRDARLIDTIRQLKQPVLGVCLGMQLMAEASAEENVECLGIFPGVAEPLEPSLDLSVPNMGWCDVQTINSHPLMKHLPDGSFFYFVHGYALPVLPQTVAVAKHAETFSAVVHNDNFVAAQFHPERSAATGAQLLKNFLELPA